MFGDFGACVVGANSLLRNMFARSFSQFTIDVFNTLGVDCAMSLLEFSHNDSWIPSVLWRVFKEFGRKVSCLAKVCHLIYEI